MIRTILIFCAVALSVISYSSLAEEVNDQAQAQEPAPEPKPDKDKDRLYVTDQLRLSLYQQADSRSPVIKLLASGDLLTIEELSGPYALVTTATGRKGWVKRGFLVVAPTFNLMLKDEKEKTKRLEAEIDKLGNSKMVIDQYEKDMDKLVEKVNALKAENKEATDSLTKLEQEIEKERIEQKQQQEQENENGKATLKVLWQTVLVYWEVIVPIIIGIILLSFFISKEIVETRIKRKFHGIKIW